MFCISELETDGAYETNPPMYIHISNSVEITWIAICGLCIEGEFPSVDPIPISSPLLCARHLLLSGRRSPGLPSRITAAFTGHEPRN
jgi:hypothetical protein